MSEQSPEQTRKVYLPGLHGLRFLAAFTVFFGHLEQAKSFFGYQELLGIPIAKSLAMASDGVTFFFVLSGFLITYLLLTEQQTRGEISITQFYKRRLLRIWPLYYGFTFLTFAVLPHLSFLAFPKLDMALADADYWKKLGLYMVMSPHVAIILYRHPGIGGPLWSVGVEEYFYLVWPQFMKRLRAVLPLVFLVVILTPFFFRLFGTPFQRQFFSWGRFDCMGIGGLAAWLYFRHPGCLKAVFSLPAQLIAYGMAFMHLATAMKYDKFTIWVYCLVYVTIIINVALNPKSLIKLESPFMRFMGEISYGLYVFHWLAIILCINTMLYFGGIDHSSLRNLVLLLSTFALTTGFAVLSFFGWERRFLRLKVRHAPVVAGLTAKD